MKRLRVVVGITDADPDRAKGKKGGVLMRQGFA